MIGTLISTVMIAGDAKARVDTLDVEVSTGQYMFNRDSTQARFAFDVTLPNQLTGKELYFAELYVPISSDDLDSAALNILCHPLLARFDYDNFPINDSIPRKLIWEKGACFATSRGGSQEAYFDVTPLIEGWRQREIENYGLLLFTATDNSARIRFERFDGNICARLRLFYRHE